MEMDSSRRSFDRSREPGMKKPRLSDEPNLRDPRIRSLPQRAAPPPLPASSRFRQSERDADTNDSNGGGAYQPTHQLFSELVNQYRTALAELTINSKPIITNLTIIAGENLHAAKAIAATICNHIIEVPSEQKLPSLYLLDSIVKNIGRDYIKYFSTRLPEVFCKAYKQVDPSVHAGMRHLFRTWEGVFPLQPLQIIEKELCISLAVNGVGSVSARSKPESQSQYPQQSIHVNPKYLEARQDIQPPSRAKGMTTDISADVNKPSVSAARLQMQRRETLRDPVYEKDAEGMFDDYDYAVMRSGLGEHEKNWYATGSDVADTVMDQHNGYDGRHKVINYSTTQPHAGRSNGGMSRSWKNSEEEEYLWDDINSRVINPSAPNDHRKNNMVFDDSDDMEYTDGMNYRAVATLQSRQSSDYAGVQGSASPLVERKVLPSQVMRQPTIGAVAKSVPNNIATVGHKRPAPTSRQPALHQRSPSPSFSAGHDSSSVSSMAELELPVSQSIQRPIAKSAQVAEQANIRPRGQLKREISPALPTNKKQLPESQKSRLVSSSLPSGQQRVQQRSLPQHLRSEGKFSELSVQSLKQPISEGPTPGTSSAEAVNQLSSSGLLTAVFNSGVLSTSVNNAKLEVDSKEIHQKADPRLQPPVPGGPARRLLASKSPKILAASLASKQSQDKKSALPDSKKTTGPSLTSRGKALSQKTVELKTDAANPFSSLLSTLMEKGLITTSKDESPTTLPLSDGSQISNLGDISKSLQASGVPAFSSLPSLFQKDEASVSEQAHLCSAPEIKSLIGFEFKPNIIRKLHEPVIEELIDGFPFRCNICGLRLKFQEQLEKHMDWHSAKEHDNAYGVSRRWFSDLDHWVAGRTGNVVDVPAEIEESDIEDEHGMVPADESQCVCVLCGEMFDDHYSQEKDEWMFRGAMHVKVSCLDIVSQTMNDGPVPDLIVHVDCYTENAALELGLVAKVKVEEDP